MGFGFVIGLINLIYFATRIKDHVFTALRSSLTAIGYTSSSQSVESFTTCCFVVASSSEHSLSSVFPKCAPSSGTSFLQ
jgi:hypothetical protein